MRAWPGAGMAPALGGDRAGAAADEDDDVGAHRRSARVSGVPPLVPTTPTASGWRSSIEPLPLMVVATGARELLRELCELGLGAGDHHAAAADEQRAASPRAAASAARSTVAGSGAARRDGIACRASDRPTHRLRRPVAFCTSNGSADMRRARAAGGHLRRRPARTRAGCRSARSITAFHLVSGRNSALLVELGQREAAARGDRDVGIDRRAPGSSDSFASTSPGRM